MATDPKVLEPAPAVNESPDFDAVVERMLAGAKERIQAALKRARELGMIDERGKCLSKT
jgi:hypothetical protein